MQQLEQLVLSKKQLVSAWFLLVFLLCAGLVWNSLVSARQWQVEKLSSNRVELQRYANEISFALELPFNILDGLNGNPLLARASTPDQFVAEISNQLTTVAYNHPLFFKVRWIDKQGQEQLKYERLDSQLAPSSGFESLSQTDYHRNIMAQTPGTIYIVRVGLSRTQGQLDRPPRPTIRFALRLPTLENIDQGYILLNVDSRQLLNDEAAANTEQIYLVDSYGAWLRHPNERWTWRHEFGHPVGVDTVYPSLYAQMQQAPAGMLADASGHWLWASTNASLVEISNTSVASSASTTLLWRLDNSLVWQRLMVELNNRIAFFLVGLTSLTLVALWLHVYLSARNNWVSTLSEQKEQLRERTEKAEWLAAAKSQFLANMSHEIRTPLNAIIGYLELIKTSSLSSVQRGQIDSMAIASNSLLAIVNDVLDVSKLENKQIELDPQWVTLEKIVSQCSTVYYNQALRKSINLFVWLDPSLPEQVQVDAFRLSQVLNNLVSNAIKFTDFGDVWLAIDLVAQSDHQAQISFSIKDTGKGIEPEKQHQIFELFSQEDNSNTRLYGGIGLGLAISQQVVRVMGGADITLDSEVGKGSEFRFSLSLPCSDNTLPRPFAKVSMDAWQGDSEMEYVVQRYLDAWETNKQASARQVLICGASQALAEPDLLIARAQQLSASLVVLSLASQMNEVTHALKTYEYVTLVQRPVLPSALQQALSHTQYRKVEREQVHTNSGLDLAQVAVVDDNPTNVMVAQAMLSKLGIVATTFDSGAGILQALDEGSHFDLIFLDVHMPNMSGLQVVGEIRQRLKLYDLPVIALSAAALKEDVNQAMAAGMSEHMAKPYTLDQLQEVLTRYLP